ncbi:MAG TPA: VCBS repeat-containing protein, partial [Turneriella sp.]|nr:VCBS repeat-containing protein [Turneriella sp.]
RAVFFGESDDSRLVGDFPLNPADSVRMWALTRVVDLHGNFYEVRYRQDSGEIYPAKIIYTQNTNGGIARFRTVEFEYDENAYPNAAYSYASSSPTRTRWRLRDIVVQVNVVTFLGITIPFTGDLVRRYHLEYETSAASGLSRLISIQEFGSDNSTALSPHLFEWHTSPQDFTQTFTTPADNSGWSKNYGDTIVGDFNGDGKSDIVLQGQYDTYTNLHLSSGDTFKDTAIPMDTFTNGWRLFDFSGEESLKVTALGDIDGDGRIDIVSSFAAQNTTTNIIDRYVFSPDTTDNIGTRLIHLPKNNTSMYDATDRNIHVADFDGDGRSDILLQANTTAQASYIIRSTGIATNLTFQRIELDIAISGTDTLLIADFNGDARNDILQCTKNEALGHSTVKLHLSSYDATIAPVGAPIRFKTQNLPMLLPLDCRATLGDFNGDGKLDVISSTGGHKLYLGNGFTFADAVVIDTQSIALTGVHTAAESTLLAGDFNGDGRDDLFVYSTSSLAGAHIAYSYGENFSGHGGLTSFPWQSTDAKWRTALNDVTLADINGDGRIDIVVSEKRPQG